MIATIIQPKNSDGKTVPLCAFNDAMGRHGHDFGTYPQETTIRDDVVTQIGVIACRRCGAVLEVTE